MVVLSFAEERVRIGNAANASFVSGRLALFLQSDKHKIWNFGKIPVLACRDDGFFCMDNNDVGRWNYG
jgi:hypothetical protein